MPDKEALRCLDAHDDGECSKEQDVQLFIQLLVTCVAGVLRTTQDILVSPRRYFMTS